MGRGAANQARVGDAGEANPRNMARLGEDTLEIPDRLGGFRKMVGEKATTVVLGEDAGEAPFVALKGANIKNIHHKDVAGLGTIDPDWSTQDVDNFEVHILNVLGIVIIFDLAIGPVLALDPKHISWVDRSNGGDVRVPAVVPRHLLLIHGLGQINLEQSFWHRTCQVRNNLIQSDPCAGHGNDCYRCGGMGLFLSLGAIIEVSAPT